MPRRLVTAGWSLIALSAFAATAVVVAGAFSARRDAPQFNMWVGWATISAVPPAMLGVVMVAWEKMAGKDDGSGGVRRTIEDELAAAVLAEAQAARSRLIGPGEPDDQPANIRYVRSPGRFREVGGAGHGDLASIMHYYQSLSPRRMVILGNPGAGKTVLALELQVRLLEARRHAPDTPIPVLISASAYDAGSAWDEWLIRHLALRFDIKDRTAADLVRDGRILPLVDVLDEMDPAETTAPGRGRSLVGALNASMSGSQRAPVVATCRHRQYKALTPGIDRATHIELTGLMPAEEAAYLKGQFRTEDETRRWEPVLDELEAHPDGPLTAELATPWRLTLALASFRDDGDPAALLPTGAIVDGDYAQHVNRMLLSGYVPAAVRLYAAGTHYTEPQVQRWLTALAEGLAWQARRGRSATDILLHEWRRPTGIRARKAAYAALIISLVLAAVIVTAVTSQGLCLAMIAPAAVTAVRAVNPAPTLYTANIRRIAALRGLGTLRSSTAPRLMFAIAGMFVIAALLGLASAVRFGVWPGLVWGLVFGAVCLAGFVLAALAGLERVSPQAGRAREVIRANGQSGFVFGLVSGVVLGFASAAEYGFMFGRQDEPVAFADGSIIGFAFGFAVWAGTWISYRVTVIINAVRGRGPWRFMDFLDWGTKADLLRTSGIAYQFRHRQLQDWLTSPPAGNTGGSLDT